MTHAEIRLIEEAWQSLVERLGWTEATRFVMLIDRRTGGALQHLQALAAGSRPVNRHYATSSSHRSLTYYDYADEEATSDSYSFNA